MNHAINPQSDDTDEVARLRKELERATLFLRNASDCMCILDSNCRVVDVNDLTCATLGYDKAELIGARPTLWDASLAEDEIDARCAAMFEGGVRVEFETTHRRKDGTVIPVSISALPIRVDGEDLLFCLSRDISERNRVQAELRESEEKYRAMFSSANVGMALCEMDGTLIEVNEEYARIIGRTIEDTLSLTYWDVTPRDYEPQEADQLASLQSSGRYGPFEKEYLHKDGRRIPVLLNGCIVHSASGEPQIWSVVQDITERKRIEEAAEAANRSKTEFLANMSHELRTPLTAIIGLSETLEMQTFGPSHNPKIDEYISDIRKAGQVLFTLVNSVLDVAKVEAGKEEHQPVEVDLHQILNESSGLIRVLAAEKGLSVTLDHPSYLPTIRADPRHLSQIIVNLASNAVKYTHRGGWVRLEAMAVDPGCVEIRIRDNGVGISEADTGRVFEAFERAGDPFTAREQGTGLGLTLSKKLVELNAGTIVIDSEKGKGTCVSLRFPSV
jgi:two-component system sensor histidine kinase/response regulator